MLPFDYPQEPHERRHGPRGYGRPESYRPWLRDEFAFCCVYCRDREQWENYVGKFAVEHFLPVSSHPERKSDYDNLVYSCISCNLTKAQGLVPDPTQALLQQSVVIHEDGRIEGRTKDAGRLIDKLLLNSEECKRFGVAGSASSVWRKSIPPSFTANSWDIRRICPTCPGFAPRTETAGRRGSRSRMTLAVRVASCPRPTDPGRAAAC